MTRSDLEKEQLEKTTLLGAKKLTHIPVILLLLLGSLLLTACSSEGPSNAQIKEVIEGMYFKDINIVKKLQCDISTDTQYPEFNSLWLITYKYKEDADPTRERHQLLGEAKEGDYPWLSGSSETSCP